jgi:hypothetical protein
MSDPADTPAANLSSMKQDSEHAREVVRGFTPNTDKGPAEPRFASGDPVPHREMWLLERRLGAGGFGEVWLARHEYRDVPPVAVKFCTHPSKHKLTEYEKKVIVRAMKYGGDHPNVVPLLDCNLSGDTPWLIYEYVQGGTLAEAVNEQWRPLSARDRLLRTVRTLHPIAGVLAMFHRFDPPIVHRDLTPRNILMAGAIPRITDFGLGGVARPLDVTNSHPLLTLLRIAGTLAYSGPERWREPPPDPHPRDDIYALGVIAYQLLLADLHASPGTDAADDLRAMETPATLIDLILRSVSKKPDRRPKDATEWEETLTAWLPARPVASHPVAPASSGGRRISIPVPGRWSSRPAGGEGAWNPVADTPGPVRLAPDEVYSFHPAAAVTDQELAGLRVLAGAPAFQALDLSWCEQITDDGLKHLTALGQVRDLDLSGCSQITDLGLSFLTALPDLHHLDLSCCSQITDLGLRHLMALEQLQSLTLLICERLTDAGVLAFQRAIPGCKVRC